MRALIIVDIQYDFTKGGSLEVPEGDEVIPVVNKLQDHFDLVVATQDWHPKEHKSFASNNPGKKVFEKIMLQGLEQVLWPDHCIQGSGGAALHEQLSSNRIECIFRKGMDPEIDSYSGFYDNGYRKSTGMTGYLRDRKVTSVFVCGLAADYCVLFTARDAIREGFKTYYIQDATRAITPAGFEQAKAEIKSLGGKVISAGNISVV